MGLLPSARGASGPTIQVTIFEAAMAPQIGASIVALEHGLCKMLDLESLV